MHLTFLPRAKADLIEIGDYIAQDNPERARSFVQELVKHCQTLEAFPQQGTARDDVRPGFRSLIFGHYVIFYHITDTVEIVRVLHSARDMDSFDDLDR